MKTTRLLCLLSIVLSLALGNCRSLAAPGGKIPVTASSKEALAYFIDGRTLVDNLRLTDAIPYFEKALGKDPRFALAHFYLAQTAPTAREFFSHLEKAVELAEQASMGEQLWIKGFKAGAYADPVAQRKLYQELVTMFPDDERAQTLLGIAYFGQQEYAQAVQHLKKATDIAPDFAPAYNQLGYAYRFLNQYPEAEQTFKRYTELLPGDPNPYDSYAELLLKLGRFEESIAQYRKALGINSRFANSLAGIGAALMYQDKHAEARAELQKAYDIARNDGEKRAALFGLAVTYMDEGNADLARKEIEKQYAIAEKGKDAAAMAGDLAAMANILLHNGNAEEARSSFEKSVTLIKNSDLAKEVKENAALINHYNLARVAVVKEDLATAKAETEKLRQGVEAKKNKNQIRLVHELAGMIALARKEYSRAIEELRQANLQDPQNLYRLALAYQGSGRKDDARSFCTQAAKFNVLPALNYAFIRKKAETLLMTI